MSLLAIYSSPATPGNAAWAEDVTPSIRLGSITGVAGEARLGATGVGSIALDDPTSSIGHSSDGIVGLKQFYLRELACPVGNQRLWTGYVGPRTYKRGTPPDSSLRTGSARSVDVTLIDLNDFLSFRVFAPVGVDPTSSFDRPAETDLERVQGLLTDVDFLSTTLFDIGYIPSTGGVAMDANDYTGQRPIDVLNDCAQASGRNFWVKYDESGNQYVLWYDVWTTDGTDTLVYDSDLRLTNVLSEVDNTVTFAGIDAEETLDPSRLVSGVYLPYTGGTAYGTEVTTSYTYAWRDAVMPSVAVKSSATADALVARYLADNATEDSTIRVSVQLPNAYVTGIHEGMRLQVHFTHLPSVAVDFTWTRVLSRNIRVDVETQEYYWLDLELSPIPSIPEFACIEGACQRFDTGYDVTIPDCVDDGDVLVAMLSGRTENTDQVVGPDVWTEAALQDAYDASQYPGPGPVTTVKVWYRTWHTGDSGTVTVNGSVGGPGEGTETQVIVLKDVSGAPTITSGEGTAVRGPVSIGPTAGGGLLLGVMGFQRNDANQQDPGFAVEATGETTTIAAAGSTYGPECGVTWAPRRWIGAISGDSALTLTGTLVQPGASENYWGWCWIGLYWA